MGLALRGLSPVALHALGVGPLRGEPLSLDLTDGAGAPANLYAIMGQGGFGKTTLLDALAHLMDLLDPGAAPPPAPEGATMQLDLRLRLEEGGRESVWLVSLLEGAGTPLRGGSHGALRALGAEGWALLRRGAGPGGLVVEEASAPLGAARVQALQRAICAPEGARVLHLGGLAASSRGGPGAQGGLVRRFDPLGLSLERLLEGLAEPVRLARARRWIDRLALCDPGEGLGKRLAAVDATRVEVTRRSPGGGPPVVATHGADALSAGERRLAAVLALLAAHRATHTVLLLDDADLHLHPRGERGLMLALMDLAREDEGLTVVFTSHSIDMLKVLDVHRVAEGLRKGGFLLYPDGD